MLLTSQDLLTIAAEALLSGSVALYGYLFVSGLRNRASKPQRAASKPIVLPAAIDVAPFCPLPAPNAAAVATDIDASAIAEAIEEVSLPTTPVEVLPALAESTPPSTTAITLATSPGAIVPMFHSDQKTFPQFAPWNASPLSALSIITLAISLLYTPDPIVLVPRSSISPLATATPSAMPAAVPLPLLPAAAAALPQPRPFQLVSMHPITAIVLHHHFHSLQAITKDAANAQPTPAPLSPTLPSLNYEAMDNSQLIAAAKAAGFPKAVQGRWGVNRKLGKIARQELVQFLNAIPTTATTV